MQQHVKAVGILSIIFGVFWIGLGLLCLGVITGLGAGITASTGETEAAWITGTVGVVLGAIFILVGLPSLIGGMGLLKYRGWARILIIIVGVLSLPGLPIGTAYGIYAIWALLTPQAKALFT
jgi:hypothetical protein